MSRVRPAMSKAQSREQTGARRLPTRRPPRSWLGRNRGRVGAAGVAATVLVVVLVACSGGEDGSPGTSVEAAAFVGGDFHSLAADPTTPGRLFAGGHAAVSASTDGGRSWSRIGSLDGADAMGWGFASGTVYVSGHPGISRSTDGAATFRRANDGLPDTDVHAFGAGASTLYAAGPANGVIASTDGGRTWGTRTSDAGQSFFGRILTGPDDQHLIAADARTGVVESADGGRTWHRLGGPAGALWVSRSGAALYASGPRGAARRADGGRTWENLALPQGATLVEADPTDPRVLYAGVHDGKAVRVLVSRDGGLRWSPP